MKPGDKGSVRVKVVKVTTELARELGIDGAFLYSYLIEKLTNPFTMQQVVTIKEVEEEVGLNEYHQRRLLKLLQVRGFVHVGKIGNAPPRRAITFKKLTEKQLHRIQKRFQAMEEKRKQAYADFLSA